MIIELFSFEASKKFLNGEVVFKIGKDGMVTTLEDYEEKLSKYDYISTIHLQPLIYKICIAFGIEDEKVWYRELWTNEWKIWFGTTSM